VWLVGQVPLRIRNNQNLPNGTDGIDGVYETRTGEVVPYQVKWRDNDHLGFAETSTFFAATDRASIKHRVIFTNVDDFAENIKRRDGVRFVRGHHFNKLTREDFRRITAWLFQEPVRYKPLTLRRHQKQATKAIRAEFKRANRATVVMACGTGKTLVGIDVGQEAKRKVVFVPSLALMSQTIDVWCRELGDKMPPFISVCSDKTVYRDSQYDSFVDVATDVDFQVSTNTQEVRDFLERTNECVVFSTYHSASVVGKAANGYAFDMGIFDEAHRTVGISASRFAFALHEKKIKIRKRLFMTATPRQIRKAMRGKDYNYVCMEDTAVYGNRVYKMTFNKAVEAGIICPYKIVITCLTKADVTRKKMRRGITLVKGDPAGTYRIANALAVQQAIKKVGAKKVIAFLSRISKAKEFVADDDPHSIKNFLSANWELFSVNSQMNCKRPGLAAWFAARAVPMMC
jgi:predicted helicase